MFTRVAVLLVSAAFFSGLLGCVSADVYRLKEREVLSLQRVNDDMEVRNKRLLAEKTELEGRTEEMKRENEGLSGQIAKQSEEIAYLKNRAERLEKNGEELRENIAKLNLKIEELSRENQKLAVLNRPENLLRTLGDRLTGLQKQVEALSGENEELKSKQVIAGSEEEGTGRAGPKGTAETAGGKEQAVLVSTEKHAEEGKPEPQLHEPVAASESREQPSEDSE